MKVMKTLIGITKNINKLLTWTSGACLVFMVLLTCANIFFRIVWWPIKGTYEIMGLFGAVVTAFALGHTQITKGHVAVDVLVSRFSENSRRRIGMFNSIVCGAFFVLAGWQMALKAETLRRTGELTETLRIIYYPFTYAAAFGCIILSLVLLTDLIQLFASDKEGPK
ncbi:MAG: TRAP transporter small permease [Deltaproteobacteria bacterium]|nr:TRAP transporter small permease [Deltaproteobacteria bacterium]MBW1956888.1 TRAP transporter small permease [Deltaproteobacteria bacterium]MBW2040820.1 TRAP transporter small permease [Deltaproteobacteria bacterium]MBW2132376.1 TRAP transporter small permease [Deltaproteobacteria bacterium]